MTIIENNYNGFVIIFDNLSQRIHTYDSNISFHICLTNIQKMYIEKIYGENSYIIFMTNSIKKWINDYLEYERQN